MPEFMVMVLANEAEEAKLAPSETKALVEGHSAYERTLRASSAYLDGERLRPSSDARRVSARDGQVRVSAGPFADAETTLAIAGGQRGVFDGPFLESKEVIGGLFFMRLSTLEEAVRWAGQTAFVKHGALEIRELWRS